MLIYTKNDLVQFNEMLLGRGEPNQQDGIGYNKADYGACAVYFDGLSDAQCADLAKRLVKYTKTQLNVDKEIMKNTAKYLEARAGLSDRSKGVSIDIRSDGTLVSFKYNETYIDVIKKQSKRQYDVELKKWIIPHDCIIQTLNELKNVGADVENALKHLERHVQSIS